MKCVICKHGSTKTGTMTATFERGSATIVIKGVPAEVCEICGESYLSEEVSRKLLKQAEEAASAGVQVDIRKYMAA
jgi:YgiT-type zinc finger domain-containing protein